MRKNKKKQEVASDRSWCRPEIDKQHPIGITNSEARNTNSKALTNRAQSKA
jgi:hypothetical protein